MTVEVKTRLTIDESDAAKALRKTSSGYKQLAKDATAAGGFIKQAMATAAGVYVPKMVGGALSMAKSFFDVAAAAQGSTKSFTGLYSMFRNIPFEKASKEAKGMKEELWTMAVDLGKKPADAYASFQTLARAMGASTATEMGKARQQTEQLMVVADALGMEVGDLTGEFAMFAKAPRIMRGPMFDILRATGVFGKDMVTMNKNWAKLTESAKQGGLAKALEIQAGKLKSVPDDWEDQANSIEAILEKGKEAIGQPILEAMMPIAKEFIAGIREALPSLKAGGAAIGQTIARYLKIGVEYLKFGINYAKTHSEQIEKFLSNAADRIKQAFGVALEVVKFIWAHKELIAGVVVGSKVAGGVSQAVKTAGTVANVATSAMGGKAAGEGMGAIGNMLSVLGSGSVAAGAGTMIVMLGALASFVWVGSEIYKLYKAIGGGLDNTMNADAKLELAERELAAGRIDAAKQAVAESQAIQKTYLLNSSQRSRQRQKTDELSKSIDNMASQASRAQSLIDSVRIPEGLDKAFEAAQQVSTLIEAYNTASDLGNNAMMTQAATIMAQAGVTKSMIEQAGITVAGGLDQLANVISMEAFKTYDEFLAASSAILGGKSGATAPEAEKLKKAAGGAGVNVNMSGGQTFNIKQDYRDQDPDRVAIAFKRDIVKAALSRRSSRITNIFGVL